MPHSSDTVPSRDSAVSLESSRLRRRPPAPSRAPKFSTTSKSDKWPSQTARSIDQYTCSGQSPRWRRRVGWVAVPAEVCRLDVCSISNVMRHRRQRQPPLREGRPTTWRRRWLGESGLVVYGPCFSLRRVICVLRSFFMYLGCSPLSCRSVKRRDGVPLVAE